MQSVSHSLSGRSVNSLANLRPFQKGVSGNPGGVAKNRVRQKKDIRELARENSEAAFKRIVELVGSDDERVALMAAKEVLERAWGKPKDEPDAGNKGNLTINILRYANGSDAPKQLEAAVVSAEVVGLPGDRR